MPREVSKQLLAQVRRIGRGTWYTDPDEGESAAYAAAGEALDSWDGRGSRDAYVRRIVRHRVIDAVRRERGRRQPRPQHVPLPEQLDGGEALGTDDPGYEAVDDAQVAAQVAARLGRTPLSAREWRIIRARQAGATLAAIGRQHGITEARVHQVIAAIRRRIGPPAR